MKYTQLIFAGTLMSLFSNSHAMEIEFSIRNDTNYPIHIGSNIKIQPEGLSRLATVKNTNKKGFLFHITLQIPNHELKQKIEISIEDLSYPKWAHMIVVSKLTHIIKSCYKADCLTIQHYRAPSDAGLDSSKPIRTIETCRIR